MIRVCVFFLALAFAVPSLSPPVAEAAGKKAEKKKATKKKGRNDYTAEERARIMERARKVCRDAEGAPSQVYRIDYRKMVVYCTPPSWG